MCVDRYGFAASTSISPIIHSLMPHILDYDPISTNAHTSGIAGTIYARELKEAPGVVEGKRAAFRRISQEWHLFLGFKTWTTNLKRPCPFTDEDVVWRMLCGGYYGDDVVRRALYEGRYAKGVTRRCNAKDVV